VLGSSGGNGLSHSGRFVDGSNPGKTEGVVVVTESTKL
jgi:hypothetical protein